MAEQKHIPSSSKTTEQKTSNTDPLISSPEIINAKDIDNIQLKPDNILHLQRTLGNQYVLNLTQRKQKPDVTSTTNQTNHPTIQRAGTRSIHDQEHTVDDPGVNDLIGTTGDWMGTNPNEGLSIMGGDNGTGNSLTGAGTSDPIGTGASVVSILTGTFGTGVGVYNLVQNARMHKQANKDLATYNTGYKGDGTIPGDTELYATVALLKRKKSDAIKGEFENVGNILGGISGFINGVSGLISGATAALVAGVAFGVGAGLNALIGTISAIRDFVSAGKRAKSKKKVANVGDTYSHLYQQVGGEITTLNDQLSDKQLISDRIADENRDLHTQVVAKSGEVLTANTELETLKQSLEDEDSVTKRQQTIAKIMLLKKAIDKLQQEKADLQEQVRLKDIEAQQILQEITDLQTDIQDKESKYEEYGKMVVALKTAERKQGFGTKIGTGVVNLVGAAGGAALLAATLGAGAAAGPVGWVLSGIALVAIIGFAAGMHIKRKIRESNVKRMNQELLLVDNYIETGAYTGSLPDGYTPGTSQSAREGDIWHRQMFPTTEKKGWFNKLISKKRSGKMTMQERRDLIHNYLDKYDTGRQAEIITAGFIKALQPGGEGDQQVPNPAYSASLPPSVLATTPPTVPLRNVNMGLLAHFFGKKAEDMKTSLLSSDTDKKEAAAKLLAKKLKLGD